MSINSILLTCFFIFTPLLHSKMIYLFEKRNTNLLFRRLRFLKTYNKSPTSYFWYSMKVDAEIMEWSMEHGLEELAEPTKI